MEHTPKPSSRKTDRLAKSPRDKTSGLPKSFNDKTDDGEEDAVMAATKKGLDVLKKRWGLILIAAGAELFFRLVLFLVLAFIILSPIMYVSSKIPSGARSIGAIQNILVTSIALNSGLGTGDAPPTKMDSYICPTVDIPEWSKKSLAGGPKDCYKDNLLKAEQDTGVPWEIIAAVHFKEVADSSTPEDKKNPLEGSATRLFEIGDAIQNANASVDKNGRAYLTKDGQTKKTISTDLSKLDREVTYGIAGTEKILIKYHCLNIKKASPEWCLGDKFIKERNDFYKNDEWLWGGFKDHSDKLGAIGWRKNQQDGFGNLCTIKDLMKAPNEKPGPGPGIAGGKLQLLLQWDPRWATIPYANANGNTSSCGGSWYTIGNAGCGITSMAMVLNTFGANVTPDVLVSQSYAVNGVADCVGAAHSLYQDVANRFYPQLGLETSIIDWGQAQRVLEQGRPIIAGNTIPGVSHFVVLASKQGDVVTVYDPNVKDVYTMTVSELESHGVGNGGNICVYIRKKGQ